jgi:hypothetical protein
LVRVIDGNQHDHGGYRMAPTIVVPALPFYNNFGDRYRLIAAVDGFDQAEIGPFLLTPSKPLSIDLMLLPSDATFNFGAARWDSLQSTHPELIALLTAGAADREQAQNRYEDLLEHRGAALACFLNLTTAMAQIPLGKGTPLSYLRELIWDDSMRQDRFFAWADPTIVERVKESALKGKFASEQKSGKFHPGATCSFKQTDFDTANVQLTFHENDRKLIDGVQCVKIEPDIDYYKDLGAHGLFEVLPNKIKGSITDPRQVYKMRWMAGKQAGLPEFDPPYMIV